ncbi:MAG: ATP-binding cassette domain-containing protein [Roseibium sp.]|uniref:ABC transporter ATP-binding protein n=1 Tax=Roseibium sp. TaxID=1936156 RepID=UPI002627887D|nr:oligopeptide/dipeptide ABC transporter ATP-binding protein [Roseibium sp.]MCV0425887.1 ATP-binding cassette domain-containing protein [Roseibium sp.]
MTPGLKNSSILELNNLEVHFDVSDPIVTRILSRSPRKYVKAVNDIDFSVARGATFSLVGESGCGKSTLARCVAGLISPTKGDISFNGSSITGKKARDRNSILRRMQMIFQDPYSSLDPRWRVGDIIAEPVRSMKVYDSRQEIIDRVDELLVQVGLNPRDKNKYPHEFSGGQRQRISIARSLSVAPEFLICDEPTSALDVSVQAQILNLMSELQEALDLTLLFISHDLAVIDHVSDRIGVMYLGRLCEIASKRELFETPRHPYTRMLIETIPDVRGRKRDRKPIEGEVPNPLDPPPGCVFHQRCPLANERCKREVPVLITKDGSQIACHAAEEGRG